MKFCPECGDRIADKFTFCPTCGADLNQLKEDIDENHSIEEDKDEEPGHGIPIKESPNIKGKAIDNDIGIWRYAWIIVIFVCLLGGVILILMQLGSGVGNDPVSHLISGLTGSEVGVITPVPTTPREETQYEKNVNIVKEIARDYHDTHTYMGTQTGQSSDIFVCIDMAKDVWNMIKTRGINAVIEVGNVDKDISTISEANHAWVLAEVGPEQWLAVETTGGYVVEKDANPLYYGGWRFNNPSDLKKYSCGELYCFSGTCIDGSCRDCEPGYVIGDDLMCHTECGSGKYCSGNSVCVNGQCRGCNPGYVIGDDLQCHPECGSGYCTGNSVCVNGRCIECNPGYILGSDYRCHPECGSGTYCTGDSVCIDGQCRGCNPGYILGEDYQCHPECGSGTYCITGTCFNGRCITCPSGYYLATDGLCYPY